MEKIGANKTLGGLTWEEMLEATSSKTLRNERLRDMAKFARQMGNDSELRKERVAQSNSLKRTLTDEQIIEMKKIYRNDISIGYPELAKKYGVDVVTIHNIMHGLIYQGIGGDVEIRTPKSTCPHCGMVAIKSNIIRFHGDKCKQNQNGKRT
jgi:hypothetical protein